MFENLKGNPAPTVADAGSVAAGAARVEATAELKRGRGRPRKDQAAIAGTGGARPANTISPELAAEMQRHIDACYDPKAWGALAAAPGDVMLTLTGRDFWNIGKDERETMGAAASTAAWSSS